MPEEKNINGTKLLSQALIGFVRDLDDRRAICMRHENDAAIHDTKSKELELYRMFERSSEIADHMRIALKGMPTWYEAAITKKQEQEFYSIQYSIEERMKKHKKQLPIITQSAMWEGRPFLVHAYKFETDPMMKVELIVPRLEREDADLPLHQISDALRFHEYLVPEVIASVKPFYKHHEAKFKTISDYLSQTMPKNLYATRASHIAAITELSSA